MKKTPWFPCSTPPVRPGVYEAHFVPRVEDFRASALGTSMGTAGGGLRALGLLWALLLATAGVVWQRRNRL